MFEEIQQRLRQRIRTIATTNMKNNYCAFLYNIAAFIICIMTLHLTLSGLDSTIRVRNITSMYGKEGGITKITPQY